MSSDLPPSSPPRRHSSGPPDPGAFLNPWDHGCLIRYLAWLRQAYGALPLPPPLPPDGGPPVGGRRSGLPGVPLLELFIQPRLSPSLGGARTSVDLFDLLDRHRQVVLLGGPGSGRSTLLSWVVHGLTDPGRNPVIDRLGRMVPIVLPIRALSLDDGTRTFPALLERLGELPFWYEGMAEILPELTTRGQALFAVDDLDLPVDPGVLEALREAILDGIWRNGRCTWLVTAEPGSYLGVPLVIEGVDPGRVPADLKPLVDGRRLRVPTWTLQPLSPEQVRGYALRWLALAGRDPGAAADGVERFNAALQASPRARELAAVPGLLALLAVVFTARGDIPADRPGLIDWLVAAWMAVLDDAPGAELVPSAARRGWVEALARAAEAARVAATRRQQTWSPEEGPIRLPTETPEVSFSRCVQLLQRAVREVGASDPGEPVARRFVQAVAVRPGILVGRGGGLAFVRADHQRFLAALHLAADLGDEDEHSTAVEAALGTLRSWSRHSSAQDDLVELLGTIGSSPAVVERVGRRILATDRPRELDELDELGPLALALQDRSLQEGGAEVPEPLRQAARALVDEAVERWASERRRVPPWARDLDPVARHPELDRLDLTGCAAVEDLEPLRQLKRLQRLDMKGCASVSDLGPLEPLQHLQWADLRSCARVEAIDPLGHLSMLRWLDLGGCTALADLSPLSGLQNLQALVLHGCTGITDLGPLAGIRSLRALVISDCRGITDLGPLRHLPSGGTVWVRGSGVSRIPPDLRWQVVGLGR